MELDRAGVLSGQTTEGSRLQRLGASVVLAMALVSLTLATAAVWLLVANPVAVASIIDQGSFGLLARDLARLLRDALTLLLRMSAMSMPTGDATGFVSESLANGWSILDLGRLVLAGLGSGMLWRAWPRRARAQGSDRHAR